MLSGRSLIGRLIRSSSVSSDLRICTRCQTSARQLHLLPTFDKSREDSSKSRRNARGFAAPVLLLNAAAILSSKSKDKDKEAATMNLATLILHDNEIDIIKLQKLLKEGADPNYRFEGGWTLIHAAAAMGKHQYVKILLRFGADVNSVDEYDGSPRLQSVRQSRIKFNPNYKVQSNWAGCTPLHYAVLNDDVKMVKILLDKEASVMKKTETGFLPIDLAEDAEIKSMLVEHAEKEKKKRILSLGPWLQERVVGQRDALDAVTAAVQRRDLGWQDDKPLVMLFVGSSGIGKTETAKQLAAHKNNDDPDSKVSFIRIDMSEFQERHEVSKFIGSPPGYIGHDEGGQLTKALATHPEAVVLFDEVEKAHPDVLNIMLQLFDEGRLTDGKGKTILCPNAIFVLTTNVGADQIANSSTPIDDDFKKYTMYPELKRAFRRNEFLGRINEIVYFLPFSEEQSVELVERELVKIRQYAEKQGITFTWTKDAVKLLANTIDKNYGARSLKNEVSRRVVNKLADMNLQNRLKAGSSVQIAALDNDIEFSVSSEPGISL